MPVVFLYQWNFQDNEDLHRTEVRGYCISQASQDCQVVLYDFRPFLFLQLDFLVNPYDLESAPRPDSESLLREHFRRGVWRGLMEKAGWHEESDCRKDGGCPQCCHATADLVSLKNLYFGHDGKKHLVVKIYFSTDKSRKSACYKWHKKSFRMGSFAVRVLCHQREASPLLQFTCQTRLPTCGWISIESRRRKLGAHIYEVSSSSLRPCHEDEALHLGSPQVRVLSFDIEVYSHLPNKMPEATHPEDVVFQISLVQPSTHENLLLSLGQPKEIESTTTIMTFQNERDLILGFRREIQRMDPHVLVGYNIFGFDFPYLIARMELWYPSFYRLFASMSKDPEQVCEKKQIEWKSSAYANQHFVFLDTAGRLLVDLLPIVKRDYKLDNYRLKTVSTLFVGDTKDPLTAKDIFEAYEAFLKGHPRAVEMLGVVGKYCVQDSLLVSRLFDVLQCWIGLTEMAKACQVPIISLYTQGQQIKVYSQIYKKCLEEDILVQSYEALAHRLPVEEDYCGATVFPPVPGMYEWVIPFDFASLYPTTIIAYNIDYSTYVPANEINRKEMSRYHCIRWSENEGNNSYEYYFLKEPPGVLPSLLQHLLNQRKLTKKAMKALPSSDTAYKVLDKRQLAYKVSANSMYGAMGVKKGYLPFLPGAQCTTAMGRFSIEKAAEYVKEKHKAELIYGDSISSQTPVLFLLQSIFIDLLPIEKLVEKYFPEKKWIRPFSSAKEFIVVEDTNLCTWTDRGWTKVNILVRHALDPQKDLFLVTTKRGGVEVTSDHSLMTLEGKKISPRTLYQKGALSGNALLHHPFPSYGSWMRQERPECIDEDAIAYFQEMGRKTYRQYQNNVALAGEDELPFEVLNASDFYKDCFWEGFAEKVGRGDRYEFESSSMTLLAHWIWVMSHIGFYYETLSPRMDYDANIVVHRVVFYTNKPLSFREPVDYEPIFLEKIAPQDKYVYDLTTANGLFHAGFGNIIVHNTDSIYVHFPSAHHSASYYWGMAKRVEEELLTLFPPPMKLVFEEKIYKRFLILTKKRYMAMTCQADGTVDKDLTIRGVLLARRDTSRWLRNLYEKLVMEIMHQHSTCVEECMDRVVLPFVHDLLHRRVALEDLVISKTLGDQYKTSDLPVDEKKRRLRLKALGLTEAATAEIIEERQLPAHVQLAEKMKRRGVLVEKGSRIEYVITKSHGKKLSCRLEDPSYAVRNGDLVRIDPLYYLKLATQPVDQVLMLLFRSPQVTQNLYKTCLQKTQVLDELLDLYRPHIRFSTFTEPSKSTQQTLSQYFKKKKSIK